VNQSPRAARRVGPEQVVLASVSPQHRHGHVPGVGRDGPLLDTSTSRGHRQSCAQRVPADVVSVPADWSLPWNDCSACSGISVRLAVEYALKATIAEKAAAAGSDRGGPPPVLRLSAESGPPPECTLESWARHCPPARLESSHLKAGPREQGGQQACHIPVLLALCLGQLAPWDQGRVGLLLDTLRPDSVPPS